MQLLTLLVPWMGLVLLLHTQHCIATCASKASGKVARSWEGARAAARAAYERNVQLAGLAGRSALHGKRAVRAAAERLAESAAVVYGSDIVVNTCAPAAGIAAAGKAGLPGRGTAQEAQVRATAVKEEQQQQQQQQLVTTKRDKMDQAASTASGDTSQPCVCQAGSIPPAVATAAATASPALRQPQPFSAAERSNSAGHTGGGGQQQQQNQEKMQEKQQRQQHNQQQEPKLRDYVWLWTHLGCFVFGWLLHRRPGTQQVATAAATGQQGGIHQHTRVMTGAAAEAERSSVQAGPVSRRLMVQQQQASHIVGDTQQQQCQQLATVASSCGRCRVPDACEAPAGDQHQQEQQQQQQQAQEHQHSQSAMEAAERDDSSPAGAASAAAPAAVLTAHCSPKHAKDLQAVAFLSSTCPESPASGHATAACDGGHSPASSSSSSSAIRKPQKQLRLRRGVALHTHRSAAHKAAAARDQSYAPPAAEQQQPAGPFVSDSPEQGLGMCQLHQQPRSRRATSQGRRGSRRAISHGGGGGAMAGVQAMALQPHQQQQQRQRHVLIRQEQHHQVMQVTITAGPEAVHGLIIPAVRVLQQLSAGVTSLSVMSAAVVHHLSSITSLGAQLATQLEQLLGWAGRRQRQQQLAAQQALGEQSGQMGVAVLLVGLGVAAVKVGRLWEVHQVCAAHSQQQPGSWRQRVTGTAGVSYAWQYTACCLQQLGLYAVGLLAVAWLARISVSGLLSSSRAARAWQLDLIVFRGIVCSLAGVHVVHCLGAAWLTWLLMWLVWVGCQLVLQLVQLSSSSSTLMALGVALGLPLLMAVAPFHVSGLLLQGWLLDALPWLQRALVLQGLLGLPIGS